MDIGYIVSILWIYGIAFMRESDEFRDSLIYNIMESAISSIFIDGRLVWYRPSLI